MRGVAEATPSLWVIVSVGEWHLQHLFMPLHVGEGILNFMIRAVIPCWALLQRDLLTFHDSHTKVAGGPIDNGVLLAIPLGMSDACGVQ